MLTLKRASSMLQAWSERAHSRRLVVGHFCCWISKLEFVQTMSSDVASLDSPYKPVKYVIFDMDGLLLDTEGIYTETFNLVLNRYGHTYTKEMKLRLMGTVDGENYRILINELKLPVSVESLSAEMKVELSKNLANPQLLPGVERLVMHLKKHNVPIAVGTSSTEETFVIKTGNHQSFFSQFDHIVKGGSDPDVKRGKPAPDIFLLCASRFPGKPSPSECLVFEDAPNGVRAALDAGMQVVMVPDLLLPIGEELKLATKVISSLLEFKPEEFGLPAFE